MVKCRNCVYGIDIKKARPTLGQENREIVNILESRRYNFDDFCYCERLGYIESRIMTRQCGEYSIQ